MFENENKHIVSSKKTCSQKTYFTGISVGFTGISERNTYWECESEMQFQLKKDFADTSVQPGYFLTLFAVCLNRCYWSVTLKPCFEKHGAVVNGSRARMCCAILAHRPFGIFNNSDTSPNAFISNQLICPTGKTGKGL
ncbi:MAG: hypothetical protein ACYC54_00225 [Sedimentisphaerales bacterium]